MPSPLRYFASAATLACLCAPAAFAATEGSFKKVVYEASKEQTLDLKGEIEFEYKLDLTPTFTQPDCRAEVSISYVPMYDKVRVETTVDNVDCAASSGDYRLQLRTRGDDGQVATQEIQESWRRADADRIETRKSYPVDTNRELVWVRVRTARDTNCRCDPPSGESEVPSNPAP